MTRGNLVRQKLRSHESPSLEHHCNAIKASKLQRLRSHHIFEGYDHRHHSITSKKRIIHQEGFLVCRQYGQGCADTELLIPGIEQVSYSDIFPLMISLVCKNSTGVSGGRYFFSMVHIWVKLPDALDKHNCQIMDILFTLLEHLVTIPYSYQSANYWQEATTLLSWVPIKSCPLFTKAWKLPSISTPHSGHMSIWLRQMLVNIALISSQGSHWCFSCCDLHHLWNRWVPNTKSYKSVSFRVTVGHIASKLCRRTCC